MRQLLVEAMQTFYLHGAIYAYMSAGIQFNANFRCHKKYLLYLSILLMILAQQRLLISAMFTAVFKHTNIVNTVFFFNY